MVIARALVAALLALTACNYSPGFADCVITCSPSGECPGGLACIAGRCTTGTAACTTASADSGIPESGDAGTDGGDAGLDAGDAQVPLDATHTVIVPPNESVTPTDDGRVYCAINGDNLTKVNRWWRVFRPADYGIPSTFHVTNVLFASEDQRQGTAVNVKLETYEGDYDTTVLELSKLHPLAMLPQPLSADADGPHDWTVPLSASVPSNTLLAVEITSTDQTNSIGVFSNMFHLASNTSMPVMTPKSYHYPCSGMSAVSVGRHLILRVQGTF